MERITRREFVKRSALAGTALTLSPFARVRGANDEIRVGVIGFNGHGRTHINAYNKIPGVRVAALCDADRAVLAREAKKFTDRGEKVDAYVDLRELLDDKSIDAVSTATPNHWHSLVTVWACQAGKDVCVEKPVSHNIFEGRKMVEAARKYNRMVQADLDMRSNEGVREAVRFIRRGELGNIKLVRGYCYKRRTSLGKVNGHGRIPESVDYNLWCGPASDGPLKRKTLHYEWHWVWETGCGELGNNGPHQLDICRWVLREPGLPKRAVSFGGRFGYDDDGETPNTQIAVYDYDSAPIIYEVRGLPDGSGGSNMDVFSAWGASGMTVRGGKSSPSPNTGVIVECEGGWVHISERVAYDKQGKVIRKFENRSDGPQANFIKAVRSRKRSDLRCDILEGHLSTCLCHLGNISYRLGRQVSGSDIQAEFLNDWNVSEAIDRAGEYLEANGVDLQQIPPILGPWLTIDSDRECFYGKHADRANKLLTRNYRKPFVVPERV